MQTTLDSEVTIRLSHRRYLDMTDREVIEYAQQGVTSASEYLLFKYRNLVRTKVKSYFLQGAEREDLLQVGMIGLWQAIIDYHTDRPISFPAFAKVCIQRHIITAIKASTRQKQAILNHSLSLDATPDDDDSDWNLSDIIPSDPDDDPAERLVRSEDTRTLQSSLHAMLSDFEWSVLVHYRYGKSYREIADSLQCKTKSVDNALMRIKRKVSVLPIGDADLRELFSHS